MTNKEDSKILSGKYLQLGTILLYRLVKSSWNQYNPFYTFLSLQNVNQVEPSEDLKPAVYHEPKNESEQKVAPPKVLEVKNDEDVTETPTETPIRWTSELCCQLCCAIVLLPLLLIPFFCVFAVAFLKEVMKSNRESDKENQ